MKLEDIDWSGVDPDLERQARRAATPGADVWLARDKDGPVALVVDAEGIRVARRFATHRYLWAELSEVGGKVTTLSISPRGSRPLFLTMDSEQDRTAAESAVTRHGGRLGELGADAVPPPPRPGPGRDPARSARDQLVSFFAVGTGLALIGTILSAATWPSSVGDEGGGLPFAVGVIAAGIGQLLALVAVVGWGVMYGVRAAGVDVRRD